MTTCRYCTKEILEPNNIFEHYCNYQCYENDLLQNPSPATGETTVPVQPLHTPIQASQTEYSTLPSRVETAKKRKANKKSTKRHKQSEPVFEDSTSVAHDGYRHTLQTETSSKLDVKASVTTPQEVQSNDSVQPISTNKKVVPKFDGQTPLESLQIPITEVALATNTNTERSAEKVEHTPSTPVWTSAISVNASTEWATALTESVPALTSTEEQPSQRRKKRPISEKSAAILDTLVPNEVDDPQQKLIDELSDNAFDTKEKNKHWGILYAIYCVLYYPLGVFYNQPDSPLGTGRAVHDILFYITTISLMLFQLFIVWRIVASVVRHPIRSFFTYATLIVLLGVSAVVELYFFSSIYWVAIVDLFRQL